MKVAKFGGSSVADAHRISKVKEIVESDPQRRIVVVSAPGKRHKDDVKVTDLLIACAQRALSGHEAKAEIDRVINRYSEIACELGLPNQLTDAFRADLEKRVADDQSNPGAYEDAIKAAGEDYCAQLIGSFFAKEGLDAAYLSPQDAGLLVSEEYGQAQVLKESYERLAALRERSGVVVFPGFFGYSPQGHLVTFSRGGSDLTGAILAAAVGADVYENFTDVDGISAADPRIINRPALINELTYRELRELSYGGFSVFHDEAVMPALEAGIPINLRNTNNPEHPGTWVVVSREPEPGSIVGVASDHDFCAIYVGKYLMNREKGFGRRLLQIIEEEDLSFDHAPSGVDNITLVLRASQLSEHTVDRVKQKIHELLEADTVSVEYGISILSIVGIGMRHTVGICARVTAALARAGVNIEMIIQGPSELTMIVGVKGEEAPEAVRAIYEEFYGETPVRQ